MDAPSSNAVRAQRSEMRPEGEARGLLAELAVHERNAIHRASAIESCAAGDVLLRVNARSRCVFFPVDAVVALVRPLRDNRRVELGLFGSEGMVGLDLVLDATSQLDEAVVQSAGSVYRMDADDLLHQFRGRGQLQKSLLRFAHSFLAQVAQNAVCNRYHAVLPRLAKRLLMIDDRGGSIVASTALRSLSVALAADEAAVDGAVSSLTSANAIRERRKSIAINRDVLEFSACECYETLRLQRS